MAGAGAKISESVHTGIGIAGQLHGCDPPVIHRDLKPQNIVLTPEGNLFLIDLGTVRAYREGVSHDTEFIGTRETAAPEQYGYRQTDCRTDIYALGVIYLYLLTGSMELLNTKALSQVPDDCRSIIEKCTRMEPKERYASACQLEEAVRETMGIAPKSGGKKRLKRRRRMFLLSALALAALGILGNRYYQGKPYQFHSELVEEAIGQMTELKRLTIYAYQHDTLAPLLALTDLTALDLYGRRLQSVEGIENLSELCFLGINNTAVQDITPLASLEQLSWLGLDNTEWRADCPEKLQLQCRRTRWQRHRSAVCHRR